MVWKKHRTRIAKGIRLLQSQSSDMYLFLHAFFRTFIFIYFIISVSSYLELPTSIHSSTILFHNWQIPTLQNSLETSLKSLFEEKILLWQIPFFLKKLKYEIPYIQKYNVIIKPNGFCTINFWPQKCMCTVNNKYILTQNGNIYTKEQINANNEQILKNILVYDALIEKNKMFEYVKPINSLLKKNCHICISSADTIDLTFETHKKYLLRCNIKTYHIAKKQNITTLENMHLQSGLQLKKNEHLIFDMRFSKQIIMRTTKTKGGLL